MIIIYQFLFGFLFSFIGSITPSMLNMTALKISLEKNKKEANYYSLGISLIVFIQAYLAVLLTEYIAKHPSFIESLEKIGIIVFFLLSIYFYKQSKRSKIPTKENKSRKENSFITGVILSTLNMFGVPFFCGAVAALDAFNLFSFEIISIISFVIGSVIGTYYILYLYGKYASYIQKKLGKLIKDINLILSFLTASVALITLIKLFI